MSFILSNTNTYLVFVQIVPETQKSTQMQDWYKTKNVQPVVTTNQNRWQTTSTIASMTMDS